MSQGRSKENTLPTDPLSHRLYKTHRKTLISYAGRVCGDKGLAEDLVHDAWLLFHRQNAAEITSPLSYLKTIIRNLSFDRRRRSTFESTTETPFEDTLEHVETAAASPEQDIAARQIMGKVMDAIDAMPERQNAAMRMYHFDGMKLREIAQKLDISIGLVHKLISDGMKICIRIHKEEP